MSRKALVLDTNILTRAVLGQKVRHLIIKQAEHIDFFAPMACFDDSCKYLPMLLAKRNIPADPAWPAGPACQWGFTLDLPYLWLSDDSSPLRH